MDFSEETDITNIASHSYEILLAC